MNKLTVSITGKKQLYLPIVLLIILFCFRPASLSAQTNFSGQWVMDKAKSDESFRRWDITLNVKQDDKSFTKTEVLTENGKSITYDPDTYTLDGKVVSVEQYGGIDKKSVIWSADKKELTLRIVRTNDGKDYGSDETYSLSPDGKVLTMKITGIGESKGPAMIKVYNKKR